jgi:hypothetical protein
LSLYVESSAVLNAWLKQSSATHVWPLLAAPERIFTSELTCIECERAFLRGETLGTLSPDERSALQQEAARFWQKCYVLPFSAAVADRARRRFPSEPVRTLDALHLAFFSEAMALLPSLAMLSLDERVRSAARGLGATVLPETV